MASKNSVEDRKLWLSCILVEFSEGLAVASAVGCGVGSGCIGVEVGVGELIGSGLGVDVVEGVGLGVRDGDGLGVGVAVGLGVGVGDGDGLGVGDGSIILAELSSKMTVPWL
jgi:hypothetical protein